MNEPSKSVYRQVMGHDFHRLASELQRFHSMQGRVELSGRFSVKGPHSAVGRLMSAVFALPKTAAEAALKFEMHADTKLETWRRHFSSRPMVSKMRAGAGVLVERFGPIHFHFRLQADQGRLHMLLQAVTVFGIHVPKLLRPTVLGQEIGAQGRLHFDVSVHLPLVGLLAEYRGYLDIPPAES
ncbi:MAG: hypothetical protein JWP34_2045 [Massilia sp.]|nr:hypothetical protein [Massilia sp.]